MRAAQPLAELLGIAMFTEQRHGIVSHNSGRDRQPHHDKMVKTPFENEVERGPQK